MSYNQSLHRFISSKDSESRLARWMMEVQDYDFVVKYVPRERMLVADILDRDSVDPKIFPHAKN